MIFNIAFAPCWLKRLAIALCLFFVCAEYAAAQEMPPSDAPVVREIFAPSDQIPYLLHGGNERVWLSRNEYQALLASVEKAPVETPPFNIALKQARYDIRIEGEKAAIRGELALDVLAPGWQLLKLDLSGLAVDSSASGGANHPLARGDDGSVYFVTNQQGERSLVLTMQAPVTRTQTLQTIRIRLPQGAANQYRVTVKGNVELTAGATVASRSYSEPDNDTRFELIAGSGDLNLVFSLNNRDKLGESIVLTHADILASIAKESQSAGVLLKVAVLHGEIRRLQMRVSKEWDVTAVAGDLLAGWSVEDGPSDQLLTINLSDALRDARNFQISLASRGRQSLDHWRFPQVAPLQVQAHSAILTALLDSRLRLASAESKNLTPIDAVAPNDKAVPLIGATSDGNDAQREPLRVAARYYATAGDHQLTLQLEPAQRKLEVESRSLVAYTEDAHRLDATLVLVPSVEPVFSLDLLLPLPWTVESAVLDGALPLTWDRADYEGKQRLRFEFPHGLAPGSHSLRLIAIAHPAEWISNWQTLDVDVPVVQVLQATGHEGLVGVQADLSFTELAPLKVDGATPVDESFKQAQGWGNVPTILCYHFVEPTHAIRLKAQRKTPELSAELLTFLDVDAKRIRSITEIYYRIRDAKAVQLLFSLPKDSPESLQITGMNGMAIKRYSSAIEKDRRLWTVELAQGMSQEASLTIEYETPPPADGVRRVISPAVAEGVIYQHGYLAIEVDEELQFTVENAPTRADVGEISRAQYRPSAKLVDVFSYVGDQAELAFTIARSEPLPLPTTILEKVDLVTQLGAQGRAVTAAKLRVVTKEDSLLLGLPAGAELWSATVNGAAAEPQVKSGRIRLDVTSAESRKEVVLVFALPIPRFGLLADAPLSPPAIYVGSTASGDNQAFTADSSWTIFAPDSFAITKYRTDLATTELSPFDDSTPWKRLAQRLYTLSGGIHPFYWMPDLRTGLQSSKRYATTEGPSAPAGRAEDLLPESKLSEELSVPERELASQVRGDAKDELHQSKLSDSPADELRKRVDRGELAPEASLAGAVKNAPLAFGRAAWATEAFRSLRIELNTSGKNIALSMLSAADAGDIRLVNKSQWQFACNALALLVFLLGLACRDARSRCTFLLLVVALAFAAPNAVPGRYWMDGIAAALLNAAFCLVAWWILSSVANASRKAMHSSFSMPLRTKIVTATILLTTSGAVLSQSPATPRITAPADVVIVPYDVGENGFTPQDKVLVDYETYLRLWRQAHPEEAGTPPPIAWGARSGSWQATLSDKDEVRIIGEFEFDCLVEEAVNIPLTTSGGALASALLDDKPARIRFEPGQQQAEQAAGAVNKTTAVLQLPGKGVHKLRIELYFPVSREGGWRVIAGELPLAIQSPFEATIADAKTELRLEGFADSGVDETRQPQETLRTALLGNAFKMRCRSLVRRAPVDPSLSAVSDAVWLVREGNSVALWKAQLSFQQGERQNFRFFVPSEYQVEQVFGENLRSWRQSEQTGKRQVEVELLSSAKVGAQFTLRLALHGAAPGGVLKAPVVEVDGAALQKGLLQLVKETDLEVSIQSQRGLSRANASSMPPMTGLDPIFDSGATQVRPFQAFQFSSAPFELTIQAKSKDSKHIQTTTGLLRLMEQRGAFEGQVTISPQGAALHHFVLEHSGDLELTRVALSTEGDWTIHTQGDTHTLAVALASPSKQPVVVTLFGALKPAVAGNGDQKATSVNVPAVVLRGAEHSSGRYVVQADTDFEVRAEKLQGAKIGSLESNYDWLREDQRELSRLALAFDDEAPSGVLRLEPRIPIVTCRTFSNTMMRRGRILETVLLDFHIDQAGVSQAKFALPKRFARAQVNAPMLREKLVTTEGTGDEAEFTLRFQDSMLGDLRVLVELDRLLSYEPQNAAVPQLVSPQATLRGAYVMLENASDSELVIDHAAGLTQVNVAERTWREISGIFGSLPQFAYSVNSASNSPMLTYRLAQRERVQTAGAQIGLAETQMTIDAMGEYRARLTCQVDNRTEQYLTVELPAGASLWAAVVDGRAVKPLPDAGGQNTRFRVPLPKTADGDDDFPVEIVYAGRMNAFGVWSQAEAPLARSVNIPIDKSQLRLWLPPSHQHAWFEGDMRYAASEDDLAVDYLAYVEGRITQMVRALDRGGDNEFVQLRVDSQIRQLREENETLQRRFAGGKSNLKSAADQQISNNLKTLSLVESQLQTAKQEVQSRSDAAVSNSTTLHNYFSQQQVVRGKNRLAQASNNFDDASAGVTLFDQSAAGTLTDAKAVEKSELGKKAGAADEKMQAKEYAKKLSEAQGAYYVDSNEALGVDTPQSQQPYSNVMASEQDTPAFRQQAGKPAEPGDSTPQAPSDANAAFGLQMQVTEETTSPPGQPGAQSPQNGELDLSYQNWNGEAPTGGFDGRDTNLGGDRFENRGFGGGAAGGYPGGGPATGRRARPHLRAMEQIAQRDKEVADSEHRAKADYAQQLEERRLEKSKSAYTADNRLDSLAAATAATGDEAKSSVAWAEDFRSQSAAGANIQQTTGLASLQLEIPQRGQLFLFTTPRGNASVKFHSFNKEFIRRALACLYATALWIALAFLIRWVWRSKSASPRASAAIRLVGVVAGISMVIIGIFPILGVILIVWLAADTLANLHRSRSVAMA